MADRVKRSYNASGRRAQAVERRRVVVDAARQLLEERGYAATTVADVAQRAGVSAESIYKGFGTKAALAKAVLDVALAGDDEPVAVADRPEADEIRAASDVAEKLRRFAVGAAARGGRSARVQLAIRDAASLDPSIASLWQQILVERLDGMTALADHLAATGALREGVDAEHARDVLWTCIAIEVYDLLVLQRRWTRDAYTDWLTRTLLAHLT